MAQIIDHEGQFKSNRKKSESKAEAIERCGLVMRQMAMDALCESSSSCDSESENSVEPSRKMRRKEKKSAAQHRDEAINKIVDSVLQADNDQRESSKEEESNISKVLAFMEKQNELAAEREKRFHEFMLQSMAITARFARNGSPPSP
ncbi:hypothetical protein AeMF1_017159 [Aphanomyces euteiches]|nr:hypothetical protein AeMF1_017159 [Aphanomyces euteiches]